MELNTDQKVQTKLYHLNQIRFYLSVEPCIFFNKFIINRLFWGLQFIGAWMLSELIKTCVWLISKIKIKNIDLRMVKTWLWREKLIFGAFIWTLWYSHASTYLNDTVVTWVKGLVNLHDCTFWKGDNNNKDMFWISYAGHLATPGYVTLHPSKQPL